MDALDNEHLARDLPMRAETQNFSLKQKKTKLERHAIETLINNFLVKERAFYRLNERSVSIITGDIIFSMWSSERFIINISQETCRRLPKHRTFP